MQLNLYHHPVIALQSQVLRLFLLFLLLGRLRLIRECLAPLGLCLAVANLPAAAQQRAERAQCSATRRPGAAAGRSRR